MDILDLQTDAQPVWFNLTHPKTGADLEHDGKPVRLLLNSPDSPPMIALEHQVTNKRTKQMARTGRPEIKAEDLEAEATRRAIVALAGWENMSIGQKLTPFSEASRFVGFETSSTKSSVIAEILSMVHRRWR